MMMLTGDSLGNPLECIVLFRRAAEAGILGIETWDELSLVAEPPTLIFAYAHSLLVHYSLRTDG